MKNLYNVSQQLTLFIKKDAIQLLQGFHILITLFLRRK